jgi:mono/diheme cytochrome c family protein
MKMPIKRLSEFLFTTLTILGFLSLSLNSCFSGGQLAKAAGAGESLFNSNCAGCHKSGGNIVNAKKPVIGSAKLANKKALKAFLEKPTGSMPPFAAIAGKDSDLSALYDYCKTLK